MTKNKINARIIADSKDSRSNRITTFVLTYPRFIHAEVMTHRVFSRNAASSRAIPYKKMVEMVENDPFIPIAFQKKHSGMQGIEYITVPETVKFLKDTWIDASHLALNQADCLDTVGCTKQITNRLLEPFLWYTNLVTVTEIEGFYELRCPKFINEHEEGEDISFSRKDFIKKLQERYPINWKLELKDFYGIENNTNEEWFSLSESGAEIHIQALAEAMWDAQNESIPNQLQPGEWHMPFMGNFDPKKLLELSGQEPEDFELVCRKIATARAARLSYLTFDGEIDYEKDIALHDTLLASGHMSPFEHCARAMTKNEYSSFIKGKSIDEDESGLSIGIQCFDNEARGWCNNFRGFIPYRYLIEHGKKNK